MLRIVCLLILVFTVCGVLSTVIKQDDPEFYERQEFNQIIRWFQHMEAEYKKNPNQILREPDTPWLKTCAGWSAQELCSTIFGAGIDEETAWDEDVGFIPRSAVTYVVDYETRSVETTCRWFNPQNQTYKSIWREGLGCTLVEVLTEEEIRAIDVGNMTPPPALSPLIPWPEGEGFFPELAPEDIDLDCVADVAQVEFREPVANVRAITVVYKGRLVFERYALGISKETKMIGWSATKSLTGALIGVLSGDGLIDVFKPAQIPEWYENDGDERQNITVDMMLRMSSGTRWTGDVPPTTECIFWSDNNCGLVCGSKPLVAEIDTLWNYNSGSSYLLSRLALSTRTDRQYTNYEWPKQRLFYPIGAHSMYIEYQPNGNIYLGGAYGYGTARDWARFGLLYQRDGVWIDGNRILPEGWVEYSGTASHTNPSYAAHFWKMPSIDPKLFYASGFRNQNVFVFPDQELVVTRNAMPPLIAVNVFDAPRFLSGMLSCIGTNKTTSAF